MKTIKLDHEIKFRGLDLYEHTRICWHYGGYVHQTDYYGTQCDKHFIIDGTQTYDNDIGEAFLVQPETVVPYIGLKDDDGKEIYVGDYVKSGEQIFVVEVRIIPPGTQYKYPTYSFSAIYATGIDLKELRNEPIYWVCKGCNVIGNIYEPPKFLTDDFLKTQNHL